MNQIKCPLCQSELQIDNSNYGALFICNHCNGTFFVGWDGLPEVQAEESGRDIEVESQVVATDFLQNSLEVQSYEPEVSFDSQSFGFENSNEAQEVNSDFSNKALDYPHDYSFDRNATNEVMPVDNENLTGHEELNQNEIQIAKSRILSKPISDEPVRFDDVNDFGNQSNSGLISYEIEIYGYEVRSTLELLLDVLMDTKLGIDRNEIRSQISNGRIVLEKMSPLKTSIIISRISVLPLKYSWRQNEIAD